MGSLLAGHHLSHLIEVYGYWGVALLVGLESMGLPLPGEATLVVAAVYAARTHGMDITLVVAAATLGAVAGGSIGYWVGHGFGYRLLLRYGRYILINDARIKVGEYLFSRHGGKVVFFGRFIALLRALAALLAGINRMPWNRFLLFNFAGAVVWASIYGYAAYYFGKEVERVGKHVGLALVAVAVIALIAGYLFLRRHEAELQARAERAFPGPLRASGGSAGERK